MPRRPKRQRRDPWRVPRRPRTDWLRRIQRVRITAGLEERAILVGLDVRARLGARTATQNNHLGYSAEESLDELEVLATSAGAIIVEKILQSRDRAEAATLIGSGKVRELAELCASLRADLIVFDQELSPTQQRNLESAMGIRVVDRTQLILDIFARRARTREGQLQVELAQLNYLLPRLAGRGLAMSRLGGGIGTRGPGETQLETDRRRIYRRIQKIERDLESVRATRAVQRRQRQAVPLAAAALVGYTNAGKSTLFNRLTGADVLADARMFATLDPTVRSLVLPSNRRILLSDTVGFIRSLPVTLVQAFRATLEEVTDAALILHCVDASSHHLRQQIAEVSKVLVDIGAAATPQVLVINKIDLADRDSDDAGSWAGLAMEMQMSGRFAAVSARTGEGLDRLLAVIDDVLPADPLTTERFRIPITDGGTVNLIYEFGRVRERENKPDCYEITAEVPQSLKTRLTNFLA